MSTRCRGRTEGHLEAAFQPRHASGHSHGRKGRVSVTSGHADIFVTIRDHLRPGSATSCQWWLSFKPSTSMALHGRPLPSPPRYAQDYRMLHEDEDMHTGSPIAVPYSLNYVPPFPYSNPAIFQQNARSDDVPTTLRGGTILHKGFYDLLALIPSTPSPSRLFWRAQPAEPVAGPRYEDIPADRVKDTQSATESPNISSQNATTPVKNLKARRISKDMVSKPTGFR